MTSIIGSFVGIFFIPMIGKLVEYLGVKKMLFVDAVSFIVVYISYGILCFGFSNGSLPLYGIPVLLVYAIVIFDKMSFKMKLIGTVYLKSILVDESDLRPTISLGVSMDHAVSIVIAILSGIIWTTFGPEFVFFSAAAISFINLYIAIKVKNDNQKLETQE